MRRIAALVALQSLLVSSPAGSSLHVHEYVGHDHPDHHHGAATHDHAHSAVADTHHDSIVEEHHAPAVGPDSCDPGRHAVTIAMRCACVLQVHLDMAELHGPTIAFEAGPLRSAAPLTDVRVHGPPFDIRIPSRAPPHVTRLIT